MQQPTILSWFYSWVALAQSTLPHSKTMLFFFFCWNKNSLHSGSACFSLLGHFHCIFFFCFALRFKVNQPWLLGY
jgi:hypothetical protein